MPGTFVLTAEICAATVNSAFYIWESTCYVKMYLCLHAYRLIYPISRNECNTTAKLSLFRAKNIFEEDCHLFKIFIEKILNVIQGTSYSPKKL